MTFRPDRLLDELMSAAPRRTEEAPRNARGVYALIDHLGALRYIGSTSSDAETLYKRIHQRHRTGSENTSHYFSRMYNSGRMWRDRDDVATASDGGIAKALRNEFIAEHCRAVWVALPDSLDIAQLEAEILKIAPQHATAWNRRGMEAYPEPVELVDVTIRRLGYDPHQVRALERQRSRWLAAFGETAVPAHIDLRANRTPITPLPRGAFRFVALDVETANYDRGSICQIGLAFVGHDGSIASWVSFVDPNTDDWSCTRIHGITARTVQGAPRFSDLAPHLEEALRGLTVYQHSGFDSSAIAAACRHAGLSQPDWNWNDSVQIARRAWPELKANGGHGLGNLKLHLGLRFEHHDAGEDARAAAEVVMMAEATLMGKSAPPTKSDVSAIHAPRRVVAAPTPSHPAVDALPPRLLGTTVITQGNIDNNHINLRPFFDRFPQDAVGGSNMASAAEREITVDWGGAAPTLTDLDGSKRFFRKRAWVKEFFERNGVVAGNTVAVEQVKPYSYKVRLIVDS